MVSCKICSGEFKDSADSVVLCNHHDGPTHLGCCVDNCSGSKQPCDHAAGMYDKVS